MELLCDALGIANSSLETLGFGDLFLGDFGGLSVVEIVLVVSTDDNDKDFSFFLLTVAVVFFLLDLRVSTGDAMGSTHISDSPVEGMSSEVLGLPFLGVALTASSFATSFGVLLVATVLVVSTDDKDKDFSFFLLTVAVVFFFLDLGVPSGDAMGSTLISDSGVEVMSSEVVALPFLGVSLPV